jgi:hypothetical protein
MESGILDYTTEFEIGNPTFTTNSPDYKGGSMSYYVYEFNNVTTRVNFTLTFEF